MWDHTTNAVYDMCPHPTATSQYTAQRYPPSVVEKLENQPSESENDKIYFSSSKHEDTRLAMLAEELYHTMQEHHTSPVVVVVVVSLLVDTRVLGARIQATTFHTGPCLHLLLLI